MSTPPRLRPPRGIPAYAFLEGALLGTSRRAVEENGAALRAAGYTTLVSLEATRAKGFALPEPPTRFLVLEGHAPTMAQARDACAFIDRALARRVDAGVRGRSPRASGPVRSEVAEPPSGDAERSGARAASGVIVNCNAGSGRAGTMLAAYLILREGVGADAAIAAVRASAAAARYPGVPIETGDQLDFLHRWEIETRSGKH
ncbi:MAG: hypothetical protein ACYDCK_07965 [Thermoplasmatota archaeon]